jgi:hypothetical protein
VTVTAPPPPPVVKTVVKTVTRTVTAPAAPAAPAAPPRTTAPADAEAPASVYYANCDAARAAGAAPLYVGEPGYRSGLDRDGDGVACE